MTPPVVVGSASRDVTVDDPRGWRLGGAAAFAGLTLARLGLRPRILLGVDEDAASASELNLLRDAGADVRLVRLPTGPVFENHEMPSGRVQVCVERGARIPPVGPSGWMDAEAWLLVPVADELPDAWATVPSRNALVGLGWQGLLRHLARGQSVTRRRPRVSPLVERAELVGLSREDIGPDVSPSDLADLLSPPATLLLTDGTSAGTLVELDRDGRRRIRTYPAIPAATTIDPTGAGDAFLASLVAARLGHALAASGRRDADLRLAAAVASLVVEAPGLLGVPTLAAVSARLQSSFPGGASPTSSEVDLG